MCTCTCGCHNSNFDKDRKNHKACGKLTDKDKSRCHYCADMCTVLHIT